MAVMINKGRRRPMRMPGDEAVGKFIWDINRTVLSPQR